ncbi:MAG: NTP transferase domain-containing protein [Muribaculaceae bacterium]|nr:NTP transferase domain-containing protein [Muribaculaceae bacterium]
MNFGIIAAGEGSRLCSEGVTLPKPLVDIDGRPMMGRLLDIFISLGAERIGVVINGYMTEVADWLRARAACAPVEIDIRVKTTPSSMHTFAEIADMLAPHGRFITTTVDTIFHPEAFGRYARTFAEAPEDVAGMMAVTSFIDDEKPLYVATTPDMRISGFYDTPRADTRFISGGIYGLDRRAADVLRKCLEEGVGRMRNFQRALVGQAPDGTHTSPGLDIRAFDMGKIIDVDHASDIEIARRFLSSPQ